MANSDPIGIFDSGIGGLTVASSIVRRLPGESIVYLGDTARVPYGAKSPETVIRYARACAQKLMAYRIKALVVACNTASAYALHALQHDLAIPVVGVIEPGSRRAVAVSRTGRIGVIATAGTVASGEYPAAIGDLAPEMRVLCRACPLFVPLVEEGWTEGELPELVARAYLSDLVKDAIDTLVLGCTHYPLLRETIQRVVGPGIAIVDSAESTAEVLVELLEAADLLRSSDDPPERTFLVTDAPDGFASVGRRFFGGEIGRVLWVDLS